MHFRLQRFLLAAWGVILLALPASSRPQEAHIHDQSLNVIYNKILFDRPLRTPGRQDVQAAEILKWNDLALDAIRVNRTPPTACTRGLAMMHIAIFEALNALDPQYEPYIAPLSFDPGASSIAAVAAAAHAVAVEEFPPQESDFDTALEETLGSVPDVQARQAGRALGEASAQYILSIRKDDGSEARFVYTPGTDNGIWRPTLPGYEPGLHPHWGDVLPFAIENPEAHLYGAPPHFATAAYVPEYNEVKSLGAVISTTRTHDQTEIAYFWAAPAGTVSPPGLWNMIAADFAEDRDIPLLETARLFALLNIALADAGIVAWREKYRHNCWRPITAINLGDSDDNPDTAGDPYWMPLVETPPFPEHTSGHSVFSGAAAEILGQLLGRNAPFSAVSDGLPENYGFPNVRRNFVNFEAAASEASKSRIYGGIHFRSACDGGVLSGTEVGAEVMATQLRSTSQGGVWAIY